MNSMYKATTGNFQMSSPRRVKKQPSKKRLPKFEIKQVPIVSEQMLNLHNDDIDETTIY